jgi:CRP-like cAMP-binding protein
MAEQRVAEHLRRLPLFSRLADSELADLADRVRTKTFKRGEMIFRKDDPGTHLYMVLEGGVKIALPGEFGQEALVAIMRPGEFFGELALFDRSPRSRTRGPRSSRATTSWPTWNHTPRRSALSLRRLPERSAGFPTASRT